MKCKTNPLPFCLLLWCGLSAPASGRSTQVVDDFAVSGEVSQWSAADKAILRAENGALLIEFPQYQPGDAAAWPRATRNVEQIDFTGFNGLRIDIENPTKRTQLLQLGFRDVAGSQGQLVHRIGPGQRRTLTVDFDQAQPSGSVDFSGVQLIDLMRTQPASPMTWKLHRVEFFRDDPAQTPAGRLEDLHRQTAAALREAKKANLISREFENESSLVLQRWKEALSQPRALFGKAETCRSDLTSIFSQVRALALSGEIKSPLLVWSVPLGTPFRPAEALLQYRRPADAISVHAAKGQYEETIIRLTNLTSRVQDLRARFHSADASIAPALSLRRNQPVRASDHSIIGDALVPLDAAGVVTVGPLETVELWLRADTKNHAWPPGLHQAEIELTDLRRGADSTVKIPINVTVRNFDLATAPNPLKVQAWAELYEARSFVVRGHERQAVENLLDYGVNVLNLMPGDIPWPKLTPTGELAAPIDYRQHDQTLASLRQKGNPLILMFMNLDDNNPANWELRSGLEPGSDAWKQGWKLWLTDWTQHLRSLGLTTQDYALYLTDEPGPQELDRYRTVGRIVREIDPSIQIYINSAELYDDPKLTEELMEVTDIWQPDETVGFAADPELLPALKKYPGKELWVYACRTGMRSRRSNAHDYYRLMAWRAMRDGLSGIGYWSYCAAASEKEDLWDGTRVPASGAVLVYPAQDGVLSSVRWELIRQSIDDTKYVQLLRAAADAPSEALRSRIDALCGPRMSEIIENRDDPSAIVQWRMDAAQAIEDYISQSSKEPS